MGDRCESARQCCLRCGSAAWPDFAAWSRVLISIGLILIVQAATHAQEHEQQHELHLAQQTVDAVDEETQPLAKPKLIAESQNAGANTIENFEGVKPTWSIDESDDLIAVLAHRRVDVAPYQGRRSEFLSVVGRRGGERILATHPIPPSAAIDEFRASVWVKGNREGYQLLARVRFPRALDEDDQPRSVMILGNRYSSKGMWQQLSLQDVYQRTQAAARELRIRLRAPVDIAEAYVDQVAINVYGAAARNQIQIDELALEVAIPVTRTSRNARTRDTFAPAIAMSAKSLPTEQLAQKFQLNDIQLAQFAPTRMASIRPFGSRSQRNFVSRAVTYHGESFDFLKQLGFNTIWMDQPPTMEQLKRAYELGLFLLTPPRFEPAIGRAATTPLPITQTPYDDRILAWTLNASLINEQAAIANRVRLIKSRDPRKRPFVYRQVSAGTAVPAGVDLLVDPAPAIRNARNARISNPERRERRSRWAAIGSPLVNSSRWRPLRDQIWDGIFHGYEGFLLLTTESLEDRRSQHARNLAELFNLELSMVRPWIQPDLVERDFIASSHYDVRHLSANQSDLIFVNRKHYVDTHRRQSVAVRSNQVLIPTSKHRDVYRVEPGGLSPVVSMRVAGGTRVSLDSSKPDGILLLTDRATIVTKTMQHLRGIRGRSLELLEQVIRTELVELDRRLQNSALDTAHRSHLRSELHELHDRIAWMFEPQVKNARGVRVVNFRELDHVLGQVERVYLSLEPK